ncbi:hypothetical protein HRbin37_01044 [bacterium HR37]|nr:hypothetical protein HRbin37_01044 [bacterium HR37]
MSRIKIDASGIKDKIKRNALFSSIIVLSKREGSEGVRVGMTFYWDTLQFLC